MATSETLIDLELEYALLRKAKQDLLGGKLKSGYTHTSNGSQSVTYNLANIGELKAELRVLEEKIAVKRGEAHYGPVYWS